MLFKVPKTYKGSFVLNSLKCTLRAGQSISIPDNKISLPDIKAAINAKVLVPETEESEFGKDAYEKSSDAMLVNNTDRVLVLGDKIVLRPWGSILIGKSETRNNAIRLAEESGFVTIVSDEIDYEEEYKKLILSKKKENQQIEQEEQSPQIEATEKKETKEEDQFVIGEKRKTVAKVWDLRSQKMVDAKVVPKTEDPIIADLNDSKEEVDFVDQEDVIEEKEEDIEKELEEAMKKISEKASQGIKKKDVKPKTKKINKADESLIIDVNADDSETTASEALRHMIDDIQKTEEISFVDHEQKKKEK